MSVPYVLNKSGMYYGHKSCGYVGSVFLAELYDENYAICHSNRCGGVRAVPITDLVSDADAVQEYIDRLEAIRDAVAGKAVEV